MNQYCFTQDSVQNIIQLKKNLLIQLKKIIQFKRQGIIDTGQIKGAQKVSIMDKKGEFSLKMANIDSKYDSFIHFTIKFNSKDYSM